MSANRAVIVLRSPSAAEGTSVCCGVPLIGAILAIDPAESGRWAASELPQSPQNLAVPGFSVPHFGQTSGRVLPHCEQNRFAAGFCVPHSEQRIANLLMRGVVIRGAPKTCARAAFLLCP